MSLTFPHVLRLVVILLLPVMIVFIDLAIVALLPGRWLWLIQSNLGKEDREQQSVRGNWRKV